MQGHEWRYRQRRINRAYFLAWRHWLGCGVEYEKFWTDHIGKVTVEAVTKAIRSLKPADEWYWAVAGQELPEQMSDMEGSAEVEHEH